jgi:hypothetical protein
MNILCFFSRNAEVRAYSIRRAMGRRGYELILIHHDRSEDFERFSNATALFERVLRLQDEWAKDGWIAQGPPLKIPLGARSGRAAGRVRARRRATVHRSRPTGGGRQKPPKSPATLAVVRSTVAGRRSGGPDK